MKEDKTGRKAVARVILCFLLFLGDKEEIGIIVYF